MIAFKLPIDNAWEVVERHLTQTDMFGTATFQLSEYNVGIHRNYALLASSGLGGKRFISVAVEVTDNDDVIHLHEPARLFHLTKKYIGLPVANAHQAGAVIHVIEDAAKNGVDVIEAFNYVADKVNSVG